MEEKEYYTVKEIILGLDKTYQINIGALNKLKELCKVNPKKVSDFHFYLHKDLYVQAKPTLRCHYEVKRNPLQQIFNDIAKKTPWYIYGNHENILVSDNNSYSFKYRPFPIYIKHDSFSDLAFRNQADEILNSDFACLAERRYIYRNRQNVPIILQMSARDIYLSITEEQVEFPQGLIEYEPYEHILRVRFDNQEINNCTLDNILGIEIPSTNLPSYYIETISNSETSNKPIYIEGIYREQAVDLEIEEREEEVGLIKIKK